MQITRHPLLLPALLLLPLLPGCGEGPAAEQPAPPERPATSAATPTTPTTPSTPSTTPGRPTEVPATPAPARLRGIDASHHQGPIDWRRVADDGITFAYLKATEGTGYVDPTFAEHRRRARAAGIRVGGYHYFQLCSPGLEQAAHLAAVLGRLARDDLPPALDLELAGSCPAPPPREELLAEVRVFLDEVERRTGREPVVYLYPELEERFGFAAALEHRQWVRRLGSTPPTREWWIWQRDDSASVDGISGGVDLNIMRRDIRR